jgi:hypothetical protein
MRCYKIVNPDIKFVTLQNLHSLTYILTFCLRIFMPDDGSYKGPKHVALLKH